jgi:SpoVK/Ycf46/Vps4 family AAA+-type ATPase
MTAMEAEDAFSISLVEAHKFDPKIIRREKSSIVKKTGLLEIVESDFTLDDIGGLENLKTWLVNRKNCFSPQAKKFGITSPKGVILAGFPGTGKSLSAKAVASAWNRTLLRLDLGRIMGGIVGESESNLRKCLEIARAVAPVVLWIDEVEKGLPGLKPGAHQEAHEVTKRIFGELLTFMQDPKADVFVLATCNNLDALPDEFKRSGRIDSIFWVDFPDAVQREEIINIHLKRRGRNPKDFKKMIPTLVKLSDTFTGAEIEAWLQEALIRAFCANHEEVTLEDFAGAVTEITPVAKLMANDLKALRDAAASRGTKLASIRHEDPKADPTVEAPRKIKLN